MGPQIACTVVANNLAYARVMSRSFRAHPREREHEILEPQGLALDRLLDLWRGQLAFLKSTRALRTRDCLVRIRGLLERRPRRTREPCVIGATGGSGTRVFARLAERGGLFLGAERNEFEDALPIEHFLDAWLARFWTGGGYEPPHTSPPGMDDAFTAALRKQFAAYDAGAGGPRGWKSPRSLYVLPFLAQRLPYLRFLHVVRDGRDMALSANQLQLARYESMLLSPAERSGSEPERSIALWSRINTLAADFGERLGRAYLRLRFEDLCARPARVTRRVFRFFGLQGDARAASRLVEKPASLGRWRSADPELVARLERIGGGALARFGYVAAEPIVPPGGVPG